MNIEKKQFKIGKRLGQKLANFSFCSSSCRAKWVLCAVCRVHRYKSKYRMAPHWLWNYGYIKALHCKVRFLWNNFDCPVSFVCVLRFLLLAGFVYISTNADDGGKWFVWGFATEWNVGDWYMCTFWGWFATIYAYFMFVLWANRATTMAY